jgi:hypothetical protein
MCKKLLKQGFSYCIIIDFVVLLIVYWQTAESVCRQLLSKEEKT